MKIMIPVLGPPVSLGEGQAGTRIHAELNKGKKRPKLWKRKKVTNRFI